MAKTLAGVIFLTAAIAMAGQERGGATAVVCFDRVERVKSLRSKDCIEDKHKQKVCRIPTWLTGSCPAELVTRGLCGTKALPYYIQKIEVIDLYEAKMGRSIRAIPPKLIEIDEHEDIEAYLNRLAHRMDKYVESLVSVYSLGKSFVNSRTIQSAPAGLPPVIDIGVAPLPDPDKCVFSNMIQQVDIGPAMMFQQDERLMKHPVHSRMSEAVAWGHEIFYSYLRTYKNHMTSLGARRAMTYMITELPYYKVSEVTDSLLSLGVLPISQPKMTDGFLPDGRREDQVSTFDMQLAQQLIHFLDKYEDEYHPTVPPEDSLIVALNKFGPEFFRISMSSIDLNSYVKNHLYNTMINHFNSSLIRKVADSTAYEFTERGRRKIITEFFRHYNPVNNIPIR